MSLEDIAIKVVTLYGTTADHFAIGYVLNQNGFRDEDGELTRSIQEMVKDAVVRVKVRYY